MEMKPGLVFGVGFIFHSQNVIFTVNGKLVDSRQVPERLMNRILYPAVSLGSRDQHKVEVNLGLKKFKFNVDTYLQETHYQQIFNQIKQSEPKKLEKLKPKQQTEFKIAMADQFYRLVNDYLVSQGFNETVKAVFEDCQNRRTIDQLTGSKSDRPILDKIQIDLRGKIKHFVLTGKITEASALLEEHFPDLWKTNKVIECSLASIQFV